jgi:predicted Fe-Mo cluster-binding NifX family protein
VKIAIAADGPNLDAPVASKLGMAQYLIILDTASWDFDAIPNPAVLGHRGAGIQSIVLIFNKGVKQVLTGYCNPAISSQLRDNGVEVFTGIKGNVREAIEDYRRGIFQKHSAAKYDRKEDRLGRVKFKEALSKATQQFLALLPMLLGVVFLLGLIQAFLSSDWLKSIFTGNPIFDTLWGACFGSILAGNPITSYIIGGELLKYGISLFAVTALIITWVTVGIVQLPAEIAALGKKFALLRNGLAFLLSIPTAILAVSIIYLAIG